MGIVGAVSEQVIRHRGRSRDENGKLTPAVPDLPLTPLEIAPGGGSKTVERGPIGGGAGNVGEILATR